MKNITKILLSLIASFAISTASFAGELTVTGDAKASYQMGSSDSTTGAINGSKNIGITNEITFAATGELDNGFAWKWQTELDSGAETSSGAGIDDSQLVITTDMGTIGIYVSEGSLRGGALGWDVSAFGAGSDNGNGGSMKLGNELSGWNNLQLHTPAGLLPYGTVIKVGRSFGDTGINSYKSAGGQADNTTTDAAVGATVANWTSNEVTQYQVETTPLDGLTIKADYLDVGGVAASNKYSPEEGHISAKYSYGNLSVGVGLGWLQNAVTVASTASTVDFYENQSVGIGYAVNDSLSLSYTMEESTANFKGFDANGATASNGADNDVELEVNSIQGAYTMGGMTMALSLDDIENAGYTTAKDQKEMLFTIAMSF
jgi:hypothetical protein